MGLLARLSAAVTERFMAAKVEAAGTMPQTLLIVAALSNLEQRVRCTVVVVVARESVLMGFLARMVRFALFGREISALSPPLARVTCND